MDREQEVEECAKSDTESFAEVSESDLIALALSPNGDGANGTQKLVSLPSDSTLNSVSLTEVDGIYEPTKYTLCIITRLCYLYLYLGKKVSCYVTLSLH